MYRKDPQFAAAAEFGARVRARRHELGLSQEQLAERVGVHPTYISSVELGTRNLGLRNILRVGRALGVEPATLIEGLGATE